MPLSRPHVRPSLRPPSRGQFSSVLGRGHSEVSPVGRSFSDSRISTLSWRLLIAARRARFPIRASGHLSSGYGGPDFPSPITICLLMLFSLELTAFMGHGGACGASVAAEHRDGATSSYQKCAPCAGRREPLRVRNGARNLTDGERPVLIWLGPVGQIDTRTKKEKGFVRPSLTIYAWVILLLAIGGVMSDCRCSTGGAGAGAWAGCGCPIPTLRALVASGPVDHAIGTAAAV